jgi:hypothetical protein
VVLGRRVLVKNVVEGLPSFIDETLIGHLLCVSPEQSGTWNADINRWHMLLKSSQSV